ncbi:hypothetical protein ACGFKX_15675 [Pseudonocardia alni]|uniref:hypothetical protein n=1 Tax=Pseudonocardia alni TaxID=33907 RepID=UPI00371EBD93
MREPGGAEVLLGLGELGAGVPDREPGQQSRGCLGQRGDRRVAQAVAQRPGPGLPPGRRGHVLRRTPDRQHGDREVGALCGHEQPGGGDLLAGEQPGPARRRGQEQELPAGGRPVPADGGRDELGGYQRHRPGGAGLVATTGGAAQDPGVVGEPDADLGGGAAVGGCPQRVRRQRGRVDGDQDGRDERAPGRGEHDRGRCRGTGAGPGAEQRDRQGERGEGGGGDPTRGAAEQSGEDGGPRGERGGDEAQVGWGGTLGLPLVLVVVLPVDRVGPAGSGAGHTRTSSWS